MIYIYISHPSTTDWDHLPGRYDKAPRDPHEDLLMVEIGTDKRETLVDFERERERGERGEETESLFASSINYLMVWSVESAVPTTDVKGLLE